MANSQKQKKQKKVYFRKDYAPARAMALRSQKTSTRVRAKISQHVATVKKKVSKYAKNKLKAKRTAAETNKTIRTFSKRSPRTHRVGILTWREVTLLSSIGLCALTIAFTFVYSSIFDPVKRSEQEIARIANAYYIEYYYPRILGKNLNQPEKILADYAAAGLPTVHLRQLLLSNDGKYANATSAFSNDYYKCNTNETFVRYYPVAPYGPRDYTVTYHMACEKTNEL